MPANGRLGRQTITTATREPITEERIASEQDRVRHNIARRINQLTHDCDELIDFMLDTVRVEYPDAKRHRQNAARDLAVMSGNLPQDTPGSPARVIREEDMPKPKTPKVTLKQIINKPIGIYIREKTDDCLDLATEYYNILFPRPVFESANPDEKKYQKATRIRPPHQVAALKEMMKRSIGSRNPYAYPQTSAMEEKMLNSKLGMAMRTVMHILIRNIATAHPNVYTFYQEVAFPFRWLSISIVATGWMALP